MSKRNRATKTIIKSLGVGIFLGASIIMLWSIYYFRGLPDERNSICILLVAPMWTGLLLEFGATHGVPKAISTNAAPALAVTLITFAALVVFPAGKVGVMGIVMGGVLLSMATANIAMLYADFKNTIKARMR